MKSTDAPTATTARTPALLCSTDTDTSLVPSYAAFAKLAEATDRPSCANLSNRTLVFAFNQL
ncbi:hypothetical protein F3B56_26530 [Bacteroides ovatus]|nr:hypothetical protein F3B56_26530 [Bacteroides ovatus]